MRKKWFPVVLLTAVLASGSIAYAEGRYQTIEVFFEKLNLKLNGQTLTMNKEAIIYNGSVYVPLRNLSELLGAQVSWDNDARTVNLDFLADQSGAMFQASQKGLYQYISMKHNMAMRSMIDRFTSNDMDGLKQDLLTYSELRDVAAGMNDAEMAATLDKLFAAGELVRSGWAAKNTDNYELGWTIFKTNAKKLNDLLRVKMADSPKTGASR